MGLFDKMAGAADEMGLTLTVDHENACGLAECLRDSGCDDTACDLEAMAAEHPEMSRVDSLWLRDVTYELGFRLGVVRPLACSEDPNELCAFEVFGNVYTIERGRLSVVAQMIADE